MKTPQEIEQLNKKIAKDNEIDKVVIMLFIVLLGTIFSFGFILWGLMYHRVNTIIIIITFAFLAKFLSK